MSISQINNALYLVNMLKKYLSSSLLVVVLLRIKRMTHFGNWLWVFFFFFIFELLARVFYFLINFFFVFLGLHPQHMEVPRLGVESELHLPSYSHNNAKSEPRLQPTPYLMAILDPEPTSEARD